jgi:hypothetical protein
VTGSRPKYDVPAKDWCHINFSTVDSKGQQTETRNGAPALGGLVFSMMKLSNFNSKHFKKFTKIIPLKEDDKKPKALQRWS